MLFGFSNSPVLSRRKREAAACHSFCLIASLIILLLPSWNASAACGPQGQCQQCSCTCFPPPQPAGEPYHPPPPPTSYLGGCYTDAGECTRDSCALSGSQCTGQLIGACPAGQSGTGPPKIQVDFCTDLTVHPDPGDPVRQSGNWTHLIGKKATGESCIQLPDTVTSYRTACYAYVDQYPERKTVFCYGAFNNSSDCHGPGAPIPWIQRQFADVTFLGPHTYNLCVHVENQDSVTLNFQITGWQPK